MRPLEDARREVMASVEVAPIETVSTWDASGRVLAEDLHATDSVPPWANSAMDGFAVRAADVSTPGAVLEIVGDLPAGMAPDIAVGPGQAVRIMTGAPMPDGADTVAKVEDTEEQDINFSNKKLTATFDRLSGEEYSVEFSAKA